jgi:hypothetical protein
MVRDLKRVFGVESYLRTEDRRVLEEVIFPYFLKEEKYRDILFVGCHWYTRGYNERFEERKNYWTIDVNRSRKKYGAKQHIVDGVQNIGKHFPPASLDLVLCNGVFGWGLDTRPEVEQALGACHDCLRAGGVLVIGWDDIEERRPFAVEECDSLRRFRRFPFPPLGTDRYVTDTAYRHTYNFYAKP